jgi:hypothetical protein
LIDKLKDPRTGRDIVVFVCEFKDDLGPYAYFTADGQIKDFCKTHYIQAINEEADALRKNPKQLTYEDLKKQRLAELGMK